MPDFNTFLLVIIAAVSVLQLIALYELLSNSNNARRVLREADERQTETAKKVTEAVKCLSYPTGFCDCPTCTESREDAMNN
ncbi:MAG TPA: hypothetical protein VNQ76_18485 [Planctomicrobium sp.]|nr:hypothetical protein [Planctomicrobium sp.]